MGSSPCGCSDMFRLLSGVRDLLLLPVSHLAPSLSTYLDLFGQQSPLWSPAAGDMIVFLQDGSPGNRTRATIKAHTTQPNRPRPYGFDGLLLRLMRIGRLLRSPLRGGILRSGCKRLYSQQKGLEYGTTTPSPLDRLPQS